MAVFTGVCRITDCAARVEALLSPHPYPEVSNKLLIPGLRSVVACMLFAIMLELCNDLSRGLLFGLLMLAAPQALLGIGSGWLEGLETCIFGRLGPLKSS